MQVLICDDDLSSRFVIKRLLEENFGFTVRECSDGLEALHLLATEKFAFLILDVETPRMSGSDTLEEIRESPATSDLPVVIVSHERQEETVLHFMRLGITDFVLKPARANTLVPRIQRLLRMLPAASPSRSGDIGRIRLAPDTPAMLVEGNLDFRFFFGSQVERYGPLLHATSGAAALAAFRQTPVRLVFLGDSLGVVTASRVARKLRELSSGGVRIVRLGAVGDAEDERLYDAVMGRSYVPEVLRAALRPYVFVQGALTTLSSVVPEMADILASAATQVFGMMFESEIVAADGDATITPLYHARLEILLDDRFVLQVGVHLPQEAAVAATARLVGLPEAEIGEQECLSVAGELGNMVAGRLHARFRERSLDSKCGLPELHHGANLPRVDEANGMSRAFSMGGVANFIITLVVEDRLEQATAVVENTDAAVEASA